MASIESALIFPAPEGMFDGPPDEFLSNAREFFGIYRDLAGLRPQDRLLDIGSGIGRKTFLLADYLVEGSYEGFDPVLEGVQWCQREISSRYPNFKFRHVDLRTPGYTPFGKIEPAEFVFPYNDSDFDIAVAMSVFTHMQYDVMRHYFAEVARVLKPGGKFFASYFLMPGASGHPVFPHKHGVSWTTNPAMPEEAIAFHLADIQALYNEAGFTIDKYEPGSWASQNGGSYQDLLLAHR